MKQTKQAMTIKSTLLLLSIFLFSASLGFSQEKREEHTATSTTRSNEMVEVPSLASRLKEKSFIKAVDKKQEVNPKRRDGNKVVPGKGLPIGNDPLIDKDENYMKNPTKNPIISWVGATSGSTPTDPSGAIGPNHYVNAYNSAFRIWDREGNQLTAPASLANLWPGEDLGDPIVFYDKYADRFVITQFSDSPDGFLVAVCTGSDPVNDGWYTYRFNTNSFPDYPKYSIWSDGYYITANKNSNSASTSEVVFVIDRDKLIDGDNTAEMVGFSLPGIDTFGFFSPLGFNCNGDELPPPGDAPIVYMQDNAWFGVSTDHLKLWNINVDWDNPNSSTISSPQIINTAVFKSVFDGGSFSNLPQPLGPDIDALQATVMYMAQYRRFSDHNSVVFNFVVDLNNNSNHAGIRWYELRQDNDGDNWSIYQEGTHEQPDGHSAFCGSMAMDALGNIGMAYTVVSSTQMVSLRYTGRFESDPLNEMTVIEDTLIEGTSNNSNLRYGDYAQLTIDPIDDKTFWHIAEYFSSGRKNLIAAFKISPDLASDVGIIEIASPVNATLSAGQEVNVTIRNFGTDSVSDVPLSYQIDGGSMVNETYSGSIPPMSNVEYTFSATTDMSILGNNYNVKVFTSLSGDEDNLNDTAMVNATHLAANDLGVHSITDPLSGMDLTDNESVKVLIRNYGGMPQSNFDVSFRLNGGAAITEVIDGPLNAEATMEYTFTSGVDLSVIQEYDLEVFTSLTNDIDTSNDTNTVIVENTICTPGGNCTLGDGFRLFQLTTIDNATACSPDGYGDYTSQVAILESGNTYPLTITTHYGNQKIKVWIDFNDNLVFETDELLIENYEIADGENAGVWTDTIDLIIPENAQWGEHRMRAKSSRNVSVPTNPCQDSYRGETEDYSVNIDFGSSVSELINEPNELNINYLPDNHFEVHFDALSTSETLIINVYDALGQKVIYNRVEGDNGAYFYDFDMSYAAPGIYFVSLGSDSFRKVEKIIVK